MEIASCCTHLCRGLFWEEVTLEGGSGREKVEVDQDDEGDGGPRGQAHCTTRFVAFVAEEHLVLLLAKLPTHNTRRRFLTFVMWFDAFMRTLSCHP
jgi:hypothetical protein